jgi:hypothetical protein
MVRSQPGQIVHETLSQKYTTQKKGWWSGLKVLALSSSPSIAPSPKSQQIIHTWL